MHKYLYTHANPVNFTDPTGLFTLREVALISALTSILAAIGIGEGVGRLNEGVAGKLNPGRNYLSFEVNGSKDNYLIGRLTWKTPEGKILKAWSADTGTEFADTSTSRIFGQAAENAGPIPEGRYKVDPRLIDVYQWYQISDYDWSGSNNRIAWGNHRVPLEPLSGSTMYNRSGFFIHGGDKPGTAGCIGINNDREEDNFFSFLRSYVVPLTLKVNY